MAHRAWGLLIALGLLLGGVQLVQADSMSSANKPSIKQPLATVPQVDLQRYMGRWYEIAAIPMFFERNCASNTWAEYSLLSNGLVKVVNSCATRSGVRISSEGRAKIVDPKSHAKLKVTFLNLFGWRFWAGGDYWIIDLDPDYDFVVVGHPSRKYGWILARAPQLSQSTLVNLAERLRAQGYDPCVFLTSPQQGGLSDKKPLCQLTK